MNKEKESLQTVARTSKLIAGIDLVLAAICATNGNAHFALFMALSGLMWLYSVYIQSKADNLQGE
jgi:hypothetical protein